MRMLTFNLLWSSAFTISLFYFSGCQSTQEPQLCDALYIKSRSLTLKNRDYLVKGKCDVKIKTSGTPVIIRFPKFEALTIKSDDYDIQFSPSICKVRDLNMLTEISLILCDRYKEYLGKDGRFAFSTLSIYDDKIWLRSQQFNYIYAIKRSGNKMEQFSVITDKEIPMTVESNWYEW